MTDAQAAGAVRHSVRVPGDPAAAFAAFTERIGVWWPLADYSIFGDEAAGVEFSGGRIVEVSRSGRSAVWGEVTDWRAPDRLAFTWHPSLEPGPRTEVDVRFEADGDGTRVSLAHTGWERFGDEAAQVRAPYPQGWARILARYADVAGGSAL